MCFTGFDEAAVATLNSPRSRFISSCLSHGLNPRAFMMVRKKGHDTELKLSHLCIGDTVASLFAASLGDLPDVESVNLNDNKLTDVSLGPLVLALSNVPSLRALDLGCNNVGPKASSAISGLLSRPLCPLRHLSLQNACIDDEECAAFINAIQDNPASLLEELDLSNNKVTLRHLQHILFPFST